MLFKVVTETVPVVEVPVASALLALAVADSGGCRGTSCVSEELVMEVPQIVEVVEVIIVSMWC